MPRLLPLPWMVLYEVVQAARGEWLELPAGDRDQLRRLVLKSRGQPANLTPRERSEVKRILTKVDVKRLALGVLPKAVGRRMRRRR